MNKGSGVSGEQGSHLNKEPWVITVQGVSTKQTVGDLNLTMNLD